MLAYVFWHRPAAGADLDSYERALARFHGSLAHSPPSGFTGSAALRAGELPWLAGAPGAPDAAYEDWYLIEGWTALGVLEAAAVSRGHVTAHEEAARHAGPGAGAVYRRIEGRLHPGEARLAAWVSRPAGHIDPTMADLLDDGLEPEHGSLWQRTLVLGPAPEFCMLYDEPRLPALSGLAASRLPAGWRAAESAREALTEH